MTQKKPGRQAQEAPQIKDVTPQAAALMRQDFAALDQVGALVQAERQAELAELCELASRVGAIQALDLTRKFVSSVTLRLFQQIRDSKQIKHLPILMPDGTSHTCDSIKDACPLIFGRSYMTMLREEESLQTLGDEAYDIATRLGLNRAALRTVRALPAPQQELVRAAIASGTTKAEVLSVIEDLAEKVEKTEAEVAELKAEKEASEQLLEKKNARIDGLEKKLSLIERMPADEKLSKLHQEASAILMETLGLVRGPLRQAVIAIREHSADDQSQVLAGMVGQVQAALLELRDEFNLPDTVGDGTPEWQRWADAQDAAQGASKAV